MEDRKLDRSGAYEGLVDESVAPPPEEAANPSGVSRGDCDSEEGALEDESCNLEVTAQVEDLFLEETKPGYGIAGYEGEEDGGG